jgi:cytochrome P450
MADPLASATVQAATDTAITECSQFVHGAWRSGALRPDGLAARLLQDPGALEACDAVANSVLLAVAGIDTTAGQLCTAMFALVDEPDELARVRAAPSVAGAGAAEFARFRSPVQIITRRIIADIDTPAGTLRPGDKLMLVLGAANRDPVRYPRDADRLRLARPDVATLGFGAGPHYCVGAHLAALVVGSVIGAFVHRHQDLRPAGPAPIWRTSVVAHRPEYLWMETRPR